jgi:hypothetical protein
MFDLSRMEGLIMNAGNFIETVKYYLNGSPYIFAVNYSGTAGMLAEHSYNSSGKLRSITQSVFAVLTAL